MVFRSCISTGKRLSYYCILMLVFFSGFMKSSVVYAASLCTSLRFETMIWRSKLIRFQISLSVQNFKKPLDIFSVTANRKKASRRTFSHNFDCKGKVLKIKTVNCLCECFTELYLFFLIVSSLFHSSNRCAGCFQTYMNIACWRTQSELKMPRVSNASKDYTYQND